ncbi:MAG: hypothetical protein GX558_01815, partial [Clostridiales bacterium]|nr:hypothetical protein [Clostridiales bacterium]
AEPTREAIRDCIMCGCCSFVCPAHIPLTQTFLVTRERIAAAARRT